MRPHTMMLAAATCLPFAVALQQPAEARARVGKPAPWFELERLSGKSFTRGQLRGRPAVLVVGRTQAAAPPCKKWVLEIIRRHGSSLPVYQVIVVDKSWFVPRSLVLGKVRDFAPRHLHHRVLLEWYTVFADRYGIAKHDDPVVLVLDPSGVVRWRHRGVLTAAAAKRLDRVLSSFDKGSGATASLPPR